MKSKYKVLGIVLVAASLSLWSAQSALANSVADSTDSHHGSHVVFSNVNDYLTVYDVTYDGWGAYSRAILDVQSFPCMNVTGYNSSKTCAVPPLGANYIAYNSCLENNHGATISYCSKKNTIDYV